MSRSSNRRRVRVVRRNVSRLYRCARRMQERGWPQHAIAKALRLSRASVSRAIRGNDIWGAEFDLIRTEMERV